MGVSSQLPRLLGTFFTIIGWGNLVMFVVVVLMALVLWELPPRVLVIQTALNVPLGFGFLFLGRFLRAQKVS